MRSIIGIAILSLAVTAVAAPKSITYYMDHASAKLPSTSIGNMFNLAKFNDATFGRTRTVAKTTTTTTGSAVSITLYISNFSGVKQAVYIQTSPLLTGSIKSVCALPATQASPEKYSLCAANVQPLSGSEYNIFVVPNTSSVNTDLSKDSLYTAATTCKNTSGSGGGTSISGGVITAHVEPSTLSLQVYANSCTANA